MCLQLKDLEHLAVRGKVSIIWQQGRVGGEGCRTMGKEGHEKSSPRACRRMFGGLKGSIPRPRLQITHGLDTTQGPHTTQGLGYDPYNLRARIRPKDRIQPKDSDFVHTYNITLLDHKQTKLDLRLSIVSERSI
jgi:hypothetical protein